MRLDNNTRPLLIVPAIPKSGEIKFITPKKDIVLDEFIADKVWNVLELCDGINTIDVIYEHFKNEDNIFIDGLLNDLSALGVIADSRELYKQFHTICNNPMVYTTSATSEEIVEHSRSPRLQVKCGESYKFHRNTSSKLFQLQELRKSCRSFSEKPISIDELGGVLDIGYSFYRHAVPSAGGLYPMKLFVIVLEDQKDFPAGYYEYDNEKNCLVLFNNQPDRQRIYYGLNSTSMPFNSSAVLFISGNADRQAYKYSNRGYRFMMIEAGHIAQNISLAAVEIGLATCELGGLLDDVITNELCIEGCLSALAIAIGKKSEVEFDNLSQLTERLEKSLISDSGPIRELWLVDDVISNNFDKSYFQFLAKTEDGSITSGISTSFTFSKLTAIVEAYERQCSANVRWDILAKASDLDLDWIDPRIATPLSEDQYSKLTYLQSFNENLEIEWIKGEKYDGKAVYVPIDLVFYPINNIDRKLIVDTCSSGFAAHTDYESAIKNGLLEVIERDSLMRGWYEKSSPPIIKHSQLPTHLKKRVLYWKEICREVYFLDISQNGAVIIEAIIVSKEYPFFVSGASCSLECFENAAIKAFQEAESRLICLINEKRSGTIEPENVVGVLDHEHLYSQSDKFHDHIEYLWKGKITDKVPLVSTTIAELMKITEAIVVDITSDDFLLKVVKVISQKMIPINFGYGTEYYRHYTLNGKKVEMPHYFA